MVKRTAKSYDGVPFPVHRIDQILPELLTKIAHKRALPLEKISSLWSSLLGKELASFTKVLSFSEGILLIEVQSSTLFSLLNQQEKPRLLQELQQRFSIHDLRFRVG